MMRTAGICWKDQLRRNLDVLGEPVLEREVVNPISVCQFLSWPTRSAVESLVVKRPTPHALAHSPKHLGMLESRFYAYGLTACEGRQFAPTPHYAACDEHTGDYVIVLRDESKDRIAPPRELPPSLEQLAAMVEVLAFAHRAFQGKAAFLATSVEKFDLESFEARWRLPAQQHLPSMLDDLGSRLTTADRALATDVIAAAGADQAEWAGAGLPPTIVHTDPNPSNFLLDIHAARPAILLDWQSWRPGLGVQDLAFLLSQFLPPAIRERAEPGAFATYAMITGAPEAQIKRQYKSFLSKSLIMPVLLHKYRNPAAIWWPQFYNALQTCRAWRQTAV